MSRKAPSLRTKLASALLTLGDIPYEHAKQMSAEQIISLYQFDHGILHGIEIIDEPWNLTPRLIKPHREKSRVDTSKVAKTRRLTAEQEEFQRRILSKPCGAKREPKGSITTRGFSTTKTKRIRDGKVIDRKQRRQRIAIPEVRT